MSMYQRRRRCFQAAAPVLALAMLTVPAHSHNCEEELEIIRAEIDAMPGDSDKNLAEHQYEKAKERFAAGKEKSCLRYLGSARAAIEADRMHDE